MDDDFSGAHFAAGPAHLNGEQALQFSRDRHSFSDGDLSRTSNQGLLIVSALQTHPGEAPERGRHRAAARDARPPRQARRRRHQRPVPHGLSSSLTFDPGQREERRAAGGRGRRQQPREDRRRPTACSPTSPTTGCCRPIEQPDRTSAAGRPRGPTPATRSTTSRTSTSTASSPTRRCPRARPGPRRRTPALTADGDRATRGTRRRHALDAPGRRRSTRCARGRNVVVATGTASGKSLCYQLPIVDSRGRRAAATPRCSCSRPRRSRRTSCARSAIVARARPASPSPTTATRRPTTARGPARTPTCVLTNPEMLHMGILPSTSGGRRSCMRLRYVVVDELHTLRGIFGSHVAHVLRRLRRVCEHYGVEPDVLLRERDDRQPGRARVARCAGCRSSAIDDDGSPQAERVLRGAGNDRCSTCTPGARASANVETAELLARFVARRPPDARVHAQPARRRARRAARRGAGSSSRAPGAGRPGRGVPRRLPRPRSGASSSAELGERRAARRRRHERARARHRRRRRSTRSCSTASPARSRRCASRPGGPGAPAGAPRRCSSPATTSSTSGTPRTRPSCSTARPRRAVVNPDEPVRAARPGRVRGARAAARRPSDERWFGDGLDDAVRDARASTTS